MKKWQISLILVLTGVFFQNFTYKELSRARLNEVNEESRVLHAKELLGKYYKKSSVSRTEGLQYINIHILNNFQAGLPKGFKKKALSVTKTLIAEAQKQDFDPIFVMAVIRTESNFNPLALGTVGEMGLMQIRPETAEWIAKREKIRWKGKKSLYDPVQNIRIGVAYLKFLRDLFENRASQYLSAYNVGPGKLARLIGQDSLPRKYSTKVMKHYEEFYSQMAIYSEPSNLALNQINDVSVQN